MAETRCQSNAVVHSPWPHRLAWMMTCLVGVLLGAGALVTTLDAGMAVPDWPTTYGHWFYPLQNWLYKTGSDLFLEHGHRTVAQVVGLVAIGLTVVLWVFDPRRWMWWLSVVLVAVVSLQGVLGGLRVLGDSLMLAKLHGCTAPLVFSLCAAMVTFTSPKWRAAPRLGPSPRLRRFTRLALGTLVGVYVLIVVGVQLRQQAPDAGLLWFVVWVWTKLIAVALVAVAVDWVVLAARRLGDGAALARRRSYLLLAVFTLQVLLGLGAWVVNYGFPAWFSDWIYTLDYTVVREGPLQVWVTTAHMVTGALTLAAASTLVLWSYRLR